MGNIGDLIVFEGLDCSFKETNAKLFKKYLEEKYKGEKEVILHSFPTYESDSSYFVKEYLAGRYGSQDDLTSTSISIFFMIDMFDFFAKIGSRVLNNGGIIILDRYWYSNIYYRLGAIRKQSMADDDDTCICTEKDIDFCINSISAFLDLPKADIIFKMNTEKNAMIDTVVKKNSKNDIHESDIEYLKCVFDVFSNFSFSKFTNKKYYSPQINIVTAEPNFDGNNGYKILSKEQIFESVKSGYENIKKYS